MSALAILLICFQACLIQSAMSQCSCGISKGPAFGYATGPKYAGAGFAAPASCNAVGSGEVAVFGDLDVTGATTVSGSVPVLGGLSFAGLVPASGFVTIAGNCEYPQSAYYDTGIVGAELAGFNAGLVGGEFAGYNAGLAGAAGAIASAELAGINAGFIPQWNNAGAWVKPACGCSSPY